MSRPFEMKVGSLLPAIEVELRSSDGTPLDITGLSPRFYMKNDETGVVVISDGAMTITSATAPARAKYQWQSGDTDVEGLHSIEVELTYPGPLPRRFPGYIGRNPKVLIGQKI